MVSRIAPLLLVLALIGGISGQAKAVWAQTPAAGQGGASVAAGTGPAATTLSPPAAPAPPVAAPAPLSAHKTDPLSLVMAAHWVVKAVMAVLALSCFVVLTVLVQKLVTFALAFRLLGRACRALDNASPSPDADRAMIASLTTSGNGPAGRIAQTIRHELDLAEAEPALMAGLRDRSRAGIDRIIDRAARRLRSGTGLLGSVAATAPFIGLFGTVFGIMNSFIAIADSKTTNLSVVAPGIAEALLATAIGLVAAIPAVLVNNLCARRVTEYRARLTDFAAEVERLQSRALDRMKR